MASTATSSQTSKAKTRMISVDRPRSTTTGPMERASSLFHERVLTRGVPSENRQPEAAGRLHVAGGDEPDHRRGPGHRYGRIHALGAEGKVDQVRPAGR